MHLMLPREGNNNLKISIVIDLILRGASIILAMGQVLGAIWFLEDGAISTIFPGLLLGILAVLPRQKVVSIGWVILAGILGTCLALNNYIVPLWQKSEEMDVKVLYALELLLIIYFIAGAFWHLRKGHKKQEGDGKTE